MFDFTSAEDSKFAAIPNGTYNTEIIKAEDVTSKSGNNMFKFEFTITDGDQAGRKLFAQFVYGGPSASDKVKSISASKIKEMCKNANVEAKFNNVQDLVGLKLAVVTKIRSDETYGDRAEISYFKPLQAPKINTKDSIPF